jgi:hypothetical protein
MVVGVESWRELFDVQIQASDGHYMAEDTQT